MEWHTRWTDSARDLYHVNVYRHALVLRLLDLRAGRQRSAIKGGNAAEVNRA